MKFAFTALTLSCLFVGGSKGLPAHQTQLKSEIAEPQVTLVTVDSVMATRSSLKSETIENIATASDSIISSVVVNVATPTDDSEDENSPALPIDSDEDDDEEDDPTTPEDEVASVDNIEIKENAYSAAGIKFNKDKDLPVISQKKALDDEENPPAPQIIACKSEGQVALTYSEGPSDATARIVRHFNNAKIPGNFFVNTNWLNQQQYAMVLQNVYNAGHLIGMTYRLPTEDPESMSDDEIKEDIIKNSNMIQSLIHVAPKYVRLHFSAQNDGRVEQLLKEMGYVLVGYNLDGKDYTYTDPAQIENEYSRTFKEYQTSHNNKKGSFVAIQYDIPETGSMAAAPNIIKLLQKEGYSPVRMDGCLNDPKPYKSDATSQNYISDKFSFGTPGYVKNTQITSIISSTSDDEEIRGLSVNDESLLENAAKIIKPSLVYALVPVLIYTAVFNFIL